MKYITRNPLVSALLSFFLASCAFVYCGIVLKIALSAIFAFSAVVLIAIRCRLKLHKSFTRGIAVILIASAISGAYSTLAFNIHADGYNSHSGKTDTVTVRITECDYSLSYTARYIAVVEESNLIRRGTKLLITSEKIGLDEGCVLEGKITFSALADMNTSSFNAERYYLPKKIMLAAEDISLSVIGEKKVFSVDGFFSKVNNKLSAMIMAHFSYDAGGLQAAVLLGNRDYLSDTVSRDFRRLGISHLLVVSGTHFSVIVAFVEQAMRKLRLKRRPRACLNIALIFLFMALTGFTPSVLRAGIMYLIAELAVLVSRRVSSASSLAFAGAVMIVLNPYVAVDCGMQLSFVAAYTCIAFSKYKLSLFANVKNKDYRRPIFRFAQKIMETVLLTAFVTVSTLPLMWLYFGEVSILSIPANIIFIPAITLLMYLTGAYLILYPLKLFIGPMSAFIGVYCELIEDAAEFLAKPDFALISINYQFSIFFLIPLAVLVLILPYTGKKYVKTVAVTALAILTVFIGIIGIVNAVEYEKTRISYVSEKKNDGLAVKSHRKIMLCDISDASFGFSYNLTEEMTALHSCEIEVLLFTHYHSKHTQLFSRLCGEEIIRCIVLPTPINEREDSIYTSLCEIALKNGIEITTIAPGESYIFGDAEIILFERTYLSRSTHPITALQISAHGTDTVYASGSFNESTERIKDAIENSDYVILGRHSPVYKKTVTLLLENVRGLVISSDAYNHMDDATQKTSERIGAITEPDIYKIVISKHE